MIRIVLLTVIIGYHEILTWTPEACLGGCRNDPTGMYSAYSQKELERFTRATYGKAVVPELPLYGNPCNYWSRRKPIKSDETNYKPSEYAFNASQAIADALRNLEEIRDEFAKSMANIPTWGKLEKKFKNQKFIRAMPWYITEVLPANKKTFAMLPDSYMDGLMKRIDRVLPKIHKAGKMLLASFRLVSHYAVCSHIIARDKKLRPNLDKATNLFRRAICKLSDYMWKRGINSIHMYSFELPSLEGNKTFLIYRDTLNYLQYLNQIFDRLILSVVPIEKKMF